MSASAVGPSKLSQADVRRLSGVPDCGGDGSTSPQCLASPPGANAGSMAAASPDAGEVRDTGAERERSRSPSRNATPGQLTGTAKRWNDDKGFGFIKPDDGSEDIFCHRTSVMDGDCLVEGARLAYTKGWDDRKNKERAENVTGGAQRSAGAGAGPPPPGYGSYGAPPGYGAPPPYGHPPPHNPYAAYAPNPYAAPPQYAHVVSQAGDRAEM